MEVLTGIGRQPQVLHTAEDWLALDERFQRRRARVEHLANRALGGERSSEIASQCEGVGFQTDNDR
jgi:hypothetical protein